jgi:hypothetical protein
MAPGAVSGPSGPSLGRDRPPQKRKRTLTNSKPYPLVSAALSALVRQLAWSPRRFCRSSHALATLRPVMEFSTNTCPVKAVGSGSRVAVTEAAPALGSVDLPEVRW